MGAEHGKCTACVEHPLPSFEPPILRLQSASPAALPDDHTHARGLSLGFQPKDRDLRVVCRRWHGVGDLRETSDPCIANDRLGARGGLSAPAIPGSGRQAAAGTRALAAQDSIRQSHFWNSRRSPGATRARAASVFRATQSSVKPTATESSDSCNVERQPTMATSARAQPNSAATARANPPARLWRAACRSPDKRPRSQGLRRRGQSSAVLKAGWDRRGQGPRPCRCH